MDYLRQFQFRYLMYGKQNEKLTGIFRCGDRRWRWHVRRRHGLHHRGTTVVPGAISVRRSTQTSAAVAQEPFPVVRANSTQ